MVRTTKEVIVFMDGIQTVWVGPFEALRQRRNGGTGATMGYALEAGAHGESRCNGVRLVHEKSPARIRRRALDALKPLKSEIGIFFLIFGAAREARMPARCRPSDNAMPHAGQR